MRHLPSVQLLVVDLDNTVWDWSTIWFTSFQGLLDDVALGLSIPREQLEREARIAHVQARTTDFELVLDHMPSVILATRPKPPREALSEAMRRYYSARKRLTVLYPGVEATLKSARDAGTHIAAFTESDEFQATMRLKRTGLDGLIQDLWVAPDLAVTDPKKKAALRSKPAGEYKLHRTRTIVLNADVKKPNSEILTMICEKIGVSPWETAYVGDSLTRDIAMARDARVIAVHAKYGVTTNAAINDALVRVSHWTDQEIKIDQQLRVQSNIEPNAVLEASFDELEHHVRFETCRVLRQGPTSDPLPTLVELWKTAVDVQKSFNTISWQIRGLGITAITASVAASGLALARGVQIQLAGAPLPGAAAVLSAALLLWTSLWYMEGAWYHRLLIGAGDEAMRLEREIRHLTSTPNIGLSHAITVRSQEKPRRLALFRYQRRIGVVRARDRLFRFYAMIATALVIVTTLSAWTWISFQLEAIGRAVQ